MVSKVIIKKNSVLLAAAFTVFGGFSDAYSYASRGGVFANTQTGNIIKLVYAAATNTEWVKYFYPILSFLFGTLLALVILKTSLKHRESLVVAVEIVICALSAVLPQNLSDLSNCLLSVCCAMQYQTFRYMDENHYASIMCTNNLRLFIESLFCGTLARDKNRLALSAKYALLIICFACGAFSSALLSKALGIYALLISIPVLLLCFFLVFLSENEQKDAKNT